MVYQEFPRLRQQTLLKTDFLLIEYCGESAVVLVALLSLMLHLLSITC